MHYKNKTYLSQTGSPSFADHQAVINYTDSHRIVAVLEKATERLKLLEALNYENGIFDQTRDFYRPFMAIVIPPGSNFNDVDGNDSTVLSLLKDQKYLEGRFEKAIHSIRKSQANENHSALDPHCFRHIYDMKRKAELDDLHELSNRMKEYNKKLCEQLKENPSDSHNWKKVSHERSELISILGSAIDEMKETGLENFRSAFKIDHIELHDLNPVGISPSSSFTRRIDAFYDNFLKKVLDSQAAQLWAEELIQKEKEMNQNVKQLQDEVIHEKQDTEKRILDCQNRLSALQQQKRHYRKLAKDRAMQMKMEADARLEALEREAEDACRDDTENNRQLREAIEDEILAHKDFVNHVKERTEKLNDLMRYWEQKSQEEVKRMESRKVDISQLRREIAEKLQRREGEAEFALKLKEEKDEELRLRNLKKEEEILERNSLFDAVVVLQNALKGFLTRYTLITTKKVMLKKLRIRKKKLAQEISRINQNLRSNRRR